MTARCALSALLHSTAAHGVRCGATWFRVGEEANRITSDNFGSGCLRVVLPEAAEHRRDLRVGISAQTNKQTNRTHSSTGSDKKAHGSEAPAPTTRMSDESHAHTRAHGSGSRPHRYLAQRLEERIRVRRPCRCALSHLTEEVVQGVGDRTPAHLAEPTLRGVYYCSVQHHCAMQCNAAQHSTAQHSTARRDAARHNLPDATQHVATHKPIPRFDGSVRLTLIVYSSGKGTELLRVWAPQ